MTPVRIQRSRQQKQVSPNGLPIVYVGRPSKWGNPFKIGMEDCWNIEQVMLKYKERAAFSADYINHIKDKLKGKNLSCWCKIGEPCHADILLKIANQKDTAI